MREEINRYIWSYKACDAQGPHSFWRHFLQILVLTARDLSSGMITLHAMGLVYTTLLSLVPLLAVSISVLKGFGVHDQLEPALAGVLAHLGDRGAEVSARIVDFVDNMKFGVLGALGLVMLIYTAISLIQKIEAAFNHTWRLQSSRGLVQRFSDYLSVIMVGPLLVFGAVGITASLRNNHVVGWINALPYLNDLLHLAGKLLPYLLVICAFVLVYLLVPNTRVRFRSALYGAVVAGLLWETLGILFATFVGSSTQYTAVYSGFAILLFFMIWLYLGWVVLLVGATIAFYHQHPEYLVWRRREIRLNARQREQLALQSMAEIARAHDRQSDFKPSLENLARLLQVPSDLLQRVLDALQSCALVQLSADNPPVYLPGSAIERIRLNEIIRCVRYLGRREAHEPFCRDDQVDSLINRLEASLETCLGEQSLADFIHQNGDTGPHEDRLV